MTDVESPWDDLVGPATRAPRAVETRESSARTTNWAPSSILPDFPSQDGWAFKWVRTATRNIKDDINYQDHVIEGYEPVSVRDFPEIAAKLKLKESDGHIERGGLILCKIPQEVADKRNAYYRDRAAAEMDAADNSYLRDDDERMKKVIEKRRQVVFGR